jgi:hypothetical protein
MDTKCNAQLKPPLRTNITQTTTTTTSTTSPTMKHQSKCNQPPPQRLEETRQNKRVKQLQEEKE